MAARKEWDLKPVADRAQIFLKAADLLSGPRRAEVLAKTMVGQVSGILYFCQQIPLGGPWPSDPIGNPGMCAGTRPRASTEGQKWSDRLAKP